MTKTASAQVVTTGDRVNYAITVAAPAGVAVGETTIVDQLPAFEVVRAGYRTHQRPSARTRGERTYADVDGAQSRGRTRDHVFDGHRGGGAKCDHAHEHGNGDRHSARRRQAAHRDRDGERSGRGQHVRQLLSDHGPRLSRHGGNGNVPARRCGHRGRPDLHGRRRVGADRSARPVQLPVRPPGHARATPGRTRCRTA